MKRFVLLLAAAVIGLSTLSPLTTDAAQPQGGGQALEIAPPVLTLSVDPGETIKTTIKLRDISNIDLVVTSQINDFVAAGEDGTPKILMGEEAQTENPYSMRGWVDPLPRLTLEPGDVRDLPVTIRVPANASPGGYYGVVRFTATPPELEGTGVSLSASLGTLLLIRVSGDAKENMEIEEFFVSKSNKPGELFRSTPIDFVTRIKNTGNVHQQPVGRIMVKDMFGRTVAGVNVNLERGNVLPRSIRRFEAPLDKSVIGNKMLFGRYTAELTMTYGSNDDKTVTSTVSFWVIPYHLIIGAILALVFGFFLLRFMIRRYNENIIAKAQGKKRRKRK